MASVLITGVNGFVGKHLARAFVEGGHTVNGLTLDEPLVEELQGIVQTTLHCDLTNQSSVDNLNLASYDIIVNLAGLANVGASFNDPELYMRINVDVLRFIGKKVLQQQPNIRLIAISTGAVYDNSQVMPLSEESKVSSLSSPYAKSKLAMEQAAEELQQAGLDCIVVRPFNHIGPGQLSGFILPDLYEGLTAAVANNQPLKVGNLKTKRDYTDVRDVVNAYVLLSTTPKDSLKHTLYNVCSGLPRSGEEILKELQKNISGAKNVQIEIDTSRIRPNDPMELKGSNKRLRDDTSWEPAIAFSQTISDFVKQVA